MVVPYLRGFGTTRFLSDDTVRNGQQAALALDVIALMDALEIERAILAGFDWGARTADIVAALWPERCKGLVSVSGYLIGSQEAGKVPLPPEAELPMVVPVLLRHRTRPGRLRQIPARLREAHLADSPRRKWTFDDATFDRSAAAFDNPDHVAIVIHNYRWRLGLADGEAQYDDLEQRLAEGPVITVPTITLEGDANGAPHPDPAAYAEKFSGSYAHRTITGGIGHNLPQEAPQAFAQAIIDVDTSLAKGALMTDSQPTDDSPAHRRARPRRVRRLLELERRHRAAAGAGIQVTAPANPLRGISHDSAYIASFINQIPGPVLAVGHSYGGAVICNAATEPRTSSAWSSSPPSPRTRARSWATSTATSKDSVLGPALVPLQYPTGQGDETAVEFAIDPAKVHEVFAADLPAAAGRRVAATQRPVAELAFSEPNGPPAWKSLPSWAVVATGDKAAGTDVDRSMAERAGATITEVEGSHVIMVSQPQAVTDVILTAAAAVARPAAAAAG